MLNSKDLCISRPEMEALGSLRSVHPAGSAKHKVNLAIAIAMTLIAGGFAAHWLYAAVWTKPGKQLEYGAYLFGVIALVPGCGVILLFRKLWSCLYLFDNGFVKAHGRKGRAVRWDHVRDFYLRQDLVHGIRADLWLRFKLIDGSQVRLDSAFRDFEDFIASAQAGVTCCVVSRAEAAMSKGQTVVFDSLELSLQGLDHKGQHLPWQEIEAIAVEQRPLGSVLVVYQQQGGPTNRKTEWYAEMVARIPNVDAFLQLAGRFTTVREDWKSQTSES